MDAIKQVQLKKNRSYTSCIAESYRMFFNNLRLIFRKTWIFALICALSIALHFSLYIDSLSYTEEEVKPAGVVLSLLLMLCANIAFGARVIMLLNGRTMKWNVVRYTKIALCGLFIFFLLSIILGIIAYMMGDTITANPEKTNYLIMSFIAVIGVCTLLALPLVYVIMKYFIDPDSRLHRIIFKAYMTGLRNWGFIFTTCLLTFLLVTACTIIVSIPTIIILIANSLSVAGVRYIGDPSGLPSSFAAIRFITFAVTSFISLYISIFTVFVYYFIYGSIDTRENEKKEYLKQPS